MSTNTCTREHDYLPEVPVDIGAIPPALWGTGGATGMLGILYWLLATGRLIPRRYYEERVGDLKDQVAVKDETIRVKDDQLDKALTQGETTIRLLESIDAEARNRGQEQS